MERVALQVETVDGVAEVTLRGPGKGNALGPDFFRECPGVFEELDRDPGVRAVILRGAGDHFTYGLDLTAAMAELGPLLAGENLARGRTELQRLIVSWQGAMNAVADCRKPVIAAVHGRCIGGGMDLLAACDLRLCSREALFSLREVKVAIVADLGALQRLPRIIGEGAARDLALTGRDVDAAYARSVGLVTEVFDDPAALLAGARARAREIAENPPLVVQGVKQVLNHGADGDIRAGLRFVATWNAAFLQSLDLAEALGAFAEKRKPRFTGE
jgi:enoyl-CoA hydratase